MAARGVDDLGGPEAWFRSMPVITRYWLSAAIAVTAAGNFDVVSPQNLLWSWQGLKKGFEVWRIVTPFCYVGKFEFNTAIAIFMLYQFSKQYEGGSPYNTGAGGGTADYAFMLLFGVASMLVSYPVLRSYFPLPPIFTRSLIFFVLYVWSKRNPTAPANIWGFPMKAMFLPFAYLGLTVLMGNSWYDMVYGIAVGHVFYFLVDVVPLVYGKDILHTPQFLINFFGIGEYVPPVPERPFGREMGAAGNNTWRAPGRVNPPNDPGGRPAVGGYNWGGGGRPLGEE